MQTSGLEKARDRLWAYGYADLARLFGMTPSAVRQAVYRGSFDPGDLESVMQYAARRRERSGAE